MDRVVSATLLSLAGLVGVPVLAVSLYRSVAPKLGVNFALYCLLTVMLSLTVCCLIFVITLLSYIASLPNNT